MKKNKILLVRSKEAIADLREMGFKGLIMTDGHESTWEVDLRN